MASGITIIGGGPSAALQPTVIGGAGSSPQPSAPQRVWEPTRLPQTSPTPQAPTRRSGLPAPTVVPQGVSRPAPVASAPPPPARATLEAEPTALQAELRPAIPPDGDPHGHPAALAPTVTIPGERRHSDVALEDLRAAFPDAADHLLGSLQLVLSGVFGSRKQSTTWISFGAEVQEELSRLVKQRLSLAQAPANRSVAQHLARLQVLLNDVLEGFSPGFLRKGAAKVWQEHKTEVSLLEGLLVAAVPGLRQLYQQLEAQRPFLQACADRLDAYALATEYLLDKVPADAGAVLVGRANSLVASQANVREQGLFLESAVNNQRALIGLVQDGVLVRLTAVYTELVGLAARPTETERFVAAEKLADLIETIKNGH